MLRPWVWSEYAVKRSRSRAIAAGTNGSAYSWACVCGSDAPASRPSFTIRCT